MPGLLAQAVKPATDPVLQACGPDRDPWLCRWMADATNSSFMGDIGRVLSPWVTIAIIILVAILVNRIAGRVIRRGAANWERGERRWDRLRGRKGLRMLEKTSPVPTERRHQRAETMAGGVRSFTRIIVWTIAVFLMLGALGVNTVTLITSAGLIGVGLGFGAQNMLRDTIAGTFIIFEDQIGVGDVVDLDLASGTVEEVTLRTTRLRDVEGIVWYVPNGAIPRVGNKSQQWSRAVIDVPIHYRSDVDRAQQVIKTAAVEMWHEELWRTRILVEPEVWGVEKMTIDTITIRLVVKTLPLEQWAIGRELRARVKAALDAAGIVSPVVTTEEPPTP